MKINKKIKPYIFLTFTILIYFIFFILNKNIFFTSLDFLKNILIKILPVFIFVFILMFFSNYFIDRKFIIKHFENSGIKKWIFIVLGGILSTGPIYIWYPLLKDLKNKGFSDGIIACFLYNRGVKLPFIPIAIYYFGLKYIIILTLLMIIFSIIQGVLINKLIPYKDNENNLIS
ncbi:hypothetical protein K9L04_00160 [Patescibacteria group bacterium]|nr:hypothetical protein [Patescibacteria group bacterium]